MVPLRGNVEAHGLRPAGGAVRRPAAELSSTVVIRAFNEAASIGRTLELVSRGRPSEVIVVDSESADGTPEIAGSFPGVRLIRIPKPSFSYGRSLNTGCAAARGEVIVLLSAHAFPCDDRWLEHLLRPFQDGHVAGVYGRQLPHPEAWPFVRGDYERVWRDQPRSQEDPESRDACFFSNANAAIRRATWVRCPFDEQLPYGEDQDWAARVLRLGHTIRYEPRAAVLHSHNERLVALYRRTRREFDAYRRVFGLEKSFFDVLQYWWNAVRVDIALVRRNRDPLRWAAASPFYRLFRALGMLRPSLPRALIPRFLWRVPPQQGTRREPGPGNAHR